MIHDQTLIDRVLNRGTSEVIVRADLERRLRTTDRPLRIKFGIDPSSADLHLGHTVCFRKLRHFQDLGHTIVIIIGDWTAQIGDPSGRSATRRMLTAEEVRANAKTYTDQLFKAISPEGTEVRWQTEWFGDYTLADVFRLASRYTVAQMLAREDFHKRYANNQPLAIVELLYPLLQGYDSVAIQSDVELGGTDQTFNLLVGRDMQEAYGQTPQNIITVPLLVGTDGEQKMSKSLGNAIGVADPSTEMFAKVMSLNDAAMIPYFNLVTDVPSNEVAGYEDQLASGEINPRDVKRRLGRSIVEQFHGPDAAESADAEFLRVFSRREQPTDIPEVALDAEWFDRPVKASDLAIAAGLAEGRRQARQFALDGGIKLDGRPIRDVDPATVQPGQVLNIGRRFARLVRSD